MSRGVEWPRIHAADNTMVMTEARELMSSKGKGWYSPEGVEPLPNTLYEVPPSTVETKFIEAFWRYSK